MPERRAESRAAGKRDTNILPTTSSRKLQVYFILALVPAPLVITAISLWALQKLPIPKRFLGRRLNLWMETNKEQLLVFEWGKKIIRGSFRNQIFLKNFSISWISRYIDLLTSHLCQLLKGTWIIILSPVLLHSSKTGFYCNVVSEDTLFTSEKKSLWCKTTQS